MSAIRVNVEGVRVSDLGNSRNIVFPIAYVSVLRGLCSTILMTFLPVYAVLVDLSLPDVATVSAIATGVGVALIPLIGVAVDVVGKKAIMLASTIILSLAPITPLMIKGYFGILLAYILFNIAVNSWAPARAATIAGSVERESMGTSFAFLSLSFQISRLITPYIAGLLIKYFGYDVVFTIASLIALIAAMVTVFAVPHIVEEENKRFSLHDFFKGIMPRRDELKFLLFLCIDRSGWRLWMPILNSYMKASLGFGEDIIGLVNTFRGATSMLGVLPSGKLVDKHGWFPAILLSEILAVLSALTIIFAHTAIVMALAMAFIGLSIALWAPSFNVAISEIVSEKTELGRAYARANFYRSLTAIPSPWIGGKLYAIMPMLPMMTSTIMFLLGVGVLLTINPKLLRNK